MIRILKPGFLLSFLWLVFMASSKNSSNPNAYLPIESKINHMPFSANNLSDTFISSLLQKNPQYFGSILNNLENNGIQIIYTKIDRLKKHKYQFTDHTFNLDSNKYFYPASTVKLPVAILALQKLNELNIAGLDMNTTMITGNTGFNQTEVCNDPSAIDGRPSIANYIKKILLVSDNDAYNRLYEFLGQEYINNSLYKMGYTDVQIIHRLELTLTEEQNRQANPISFFDATGQLLYNKPATNSHLKYAERNTKLGKGFIKGGDLINEPFDFSKKNRLNLHDLHLILRSIIYPEMMPEQKKFNLKKSDYDFLRKYMSMLPRESDSPVYSSTSYWDNYVKFLFYGAEKSNSIDGVRIFNKVGDAYGFLIDASYVVDFRNNIEFFLSAVIYCNSNGIFNDDTYDYKTIGFPFLKNLGQAIYEYELNRIRKKAPQLSDFHYNYTMQN